MPLPLLLETIERLPTFARLVNSLPAPGDTRGIAGLPGSADAAVLAALAQRAPGRFFVVVAETLPDAERWLADLRTLLSEDIVALYPPREGFGEAEPHMEVAGERVETLERTMRGEVRLLVTTARALLERTRMPVALRDLRVELQKGDLRRLSELIEHLERIGLERVSMVEDVAQFSVRGGILDVYGFGMADPVRAEFWGDEIVDLRQFDMTTQRSTREIAHALVLPVDGSVQSGGEGTEQEFERRSIITLWTADTLLVFPEGVHPDAELQRTWTEAAHHIELARRRGEDVAGRDELFEPPDALRRQLHEFGTIVEEVVPGNAEIVFPLQAPEQIGRDIKQLKRIVRDPMRTIILCDNSGQAERLDELLSDGGVPSPAALTVGVLQGGFVVPSADGGLRILTDHEIFRRDRRIRRARKYSSAIGVETLSLRENDYVVHLEHGVGIYRGIETIVVGQSTVEVAVVEYEGGDRLNVPLYRIDQLERFRSAADVSEDTPPPRLHKLGGKRWSQQRDKTRSAIREMTVELLDLYARRRVASRASHVPDTPWQAQLESSFLFEDTPDQRKATVDVKKDMEGARPMDRLLVGDVGYGKTEIAVRAAFKAIQSERQVAVLVPTTILADQHARTFGERLADFPIKVAMLSRFQTAKEQAAVLSELGKGNIDIIIGTHRLLSPDVTFHKLGLIVIDEEHRFGVKHKERLKQLRLETDVLTLTATPIPRTLHMSLAGLRDMTLMQTPPRDRSPVLTYLEPWDDGLIEEAITRELDRGGQVFFVHNRIETIDAIADHVKRVVPRARIAVAHGQMRDKDLEDIMHRFVNGDVDVLVSTMIVESGLDVSNANTMFVNRADHFGLAQLYQLRGRVGRSHRRAYCYLVVPDQLDEDAERRLRVLEHHTDLGAGYRIALKDMELRGAGNLLGPEQSGFVQAVGFDLYLRLLDETVRNITQTDGAPKLVPSDVSVDTPSYLPDDYVPSHEAKLDVYRRLSRVTDASQILALRDELRDRFGPLPKEAESMLAVAQLRLLGGHLGIDNALVRGNEARVNFRDTAVPRMKGLSAVFHEVQFQAEVRRAHPLSLKLTRLGGVPIVDGLVRALTTLAPSTPKSQ
ncbi:MAG TPA: transcription-repair coupling factor [Gemmatimonadaceae bacterium]|nr:transcription-repair coupling factor [Gemmatimonadaceae bacterium]